MPYSLFDIWEAFIAKQKSVEALHRLLVKNARLTWFDIDLTNACNLVCNHCFYHDQYSDFTEPALAPEILEEAIRQAMLAQIKILTFSGKEPTLSKNFAIAITSAHRWRAQLAPETKIGLITNGITLPQHLPLLEEHAPDFVDISIDGWEYQNLIRSNTRDRVIANLQLAKRQLRHARVGTSTVVRNDNVFDIATMIRQLAPGSNYFYFEPVVSGVDKSIDSLSEDNLLLFIKLLQQLTEEFRNQEIRFSILLNGDQAIPLFYAGILEAEDIEEDELNSLYIRQHFGKAQVDFILRIVPEFYWRAARLSYDGYWLGTCDLLQAPNFRELTNGNFATTPDLQHLFTDSMKRGSLFYESLHCAVVEGCQHSPREQQYCLGCFSTALVRMMHKRYKKNLPILQVAA
jgi:MoaA/NifB/PqqE/SkfB family radical SAM enzyme